MESSSTSVVSSTGADHQIAFVERQADANPESFVSFAVHLHIVDDGSADAVPHHRVWTPRVVELHIEHPLRVRCEAGATDASNTSGSSLPVSKLRMRKS